MRGRGDEITNGFVSPPHGGAEGSLIKSGWTTQHRTTKEEYAEYTRKYIDDGKWQTTSK
jgi:hypothetical protein